MHAADSAQVQLIEEYLKTYRPTVKKGGGPEVDVGKVTVRIAVNNDYHKRPCKCGH